METDRANIPENIANSQSSKHDFTQKLDISEEFLRAIVPHKETTDVKTEVDKLAGQKASNIDITLSVLNGKDGRNLPDNEASGYHKELREFAGDVARFSDYFHSLPEEKRNPETSQKLTELVACAKDSTRWGLKLANEYEVIRNAIEDSKQTRSDKRTHFNEKFGESESSDHQKALQYLNYLESELYLPIPQPEAGEYSDKQVTTWLKRYKQLVQFNRCCEHFTLQEIQQSE